ncbi:MAG: Rieske 2Fe-2S domain-containing protein [Planctomycetes bacterium]|nr:Rieske 2Fe-2S domain-containing protein [Planctomycetota bacterium]
MILILASDTPEAKLQEIVAEATRRGWRCDVSRGDEQIVVGLSGSGDVAALESALAARADVDVLPLLSHREYAFLRSRRRMMTGLVAGFGALTAAAGALPVVGFLLPPKGTLSDRSLVRAAAKAEFAERSAKKVTVLGKPILLVRLEDERYFALSAICTHMQICHLDWNEERRELVCPCHGGAFDVYGNVVKGPPSVPLQSYAIEELGEELYIRREG